MTSLPVAASSGVPSSLTVVAASRQLSLMAADGSPTDFVAEPDGGGRRVDLAGRSVLICEDEPLVGYDIAFCVEDAGGRAIGPFASVQDALAQLELALPDAAILDVNLIDGDVTPVLLRLLDSRVPLVVNTGTRIPEEAEERDVTVFIKPTQPEILIRAIA